MELALIPILEQEVKGVKMLRRIGQELYGKEQLHLRLIEAMRITEHEDRIEVFIHLPSAIPKEIDLRSDGEQLILDINGLVNRITMPRNVEDLPITARFEEDFLIITIDLGNEA